MATEQRLIDEFRRELMSDFIALCRGNDFNKLTLLRIGETIDSVYEKFSSSPTVDAVEVPDKELLRAIKLLIKQYERSKNSEYVHSPVAHALYHTWKQVDERRTDP